MKSCSDRVGTVVTSAVLSHDAGIGALKAGDGLGIKKRKEKVQDWWVEDSHKVENG